MEDVFGSLVVKLRQQRVKMARVLIYCADGVRNVHQYTICKQQASNQDIQAHVVSHTHTHTHTRQSLDIMISSTVNNCAVHQAVTQLINLMSSHMFIYTLWNNFVRLVSQTH